MANFTQGSEIFRKTCKTTRNKATFDEDLNVKTDEKLSDILFNDTTSRIPKSATLPTIFEEKKSV